MFIDADNLNDPTALDHVLLSVRSLADRIVYRRAYGRAESLRAIEAVLWRHGVRPVANLIVDKTTTDSALVIDAVEAVCRNDIDVVAICSGDADFVPLAMWLRERRCRVLCFSLPQKIFANPESFYDEVVLIDVVSDSLPAPLSPQTPALEKRENAARKLPPAPAVDVRAKVKATPKIPAVKDLLKALPELSTRKPLHLSVAAKELRAAGLLSKTGSSTTLFQRYPAQFELLPSKQPNTVRYRG
ncbi:NYN domain-containing protein [Ottowia flava]|uniref:NYN domain-containing protein n=1 Tax=Ottowia flava TaxID=2675430 RepID=A0ABW4KYW8_9BURK|nr:NYN domain-containing protein [Ottowia sp. GY511]